MTGPTPEPPHAPTVGPLALEAALLLDVVADRLTSMKTATAAAAGDSATDGQDQHSPSQTTAPADGRCPECGSVPGASCTACPLCRFMALLRGERPEATARLVDGALMIIRTLRSLVPDLPESAPPTSGGASGPQGPGPQADGSQADGPQADGPQGSGAPTTGPTHPARHGGLEHIDIL